ncbi:MAG: adenylate cyclase [Chloroflexota bacterium]|nr:adenylate cyclase [Chloroflexota bacterium]
MCRWLDETRYIWGVDPANVRHTRGFLFADLRDYSRFTERFGDDAAAQLLARYRALVREAIARFQGAEIRTEGDSFYVVFTTVGSAVGAGLAILADARVSPGEAGAPAIHVGIGVHAGETVDTDEGIVSSAVNIAARVCSVAAPGQLLVTETVRGLTRGYLPVRFEPAGSRKLKGIAEPMRLFRVVEGTAAITATSRPSRALVAGGGIAAAVVVVLTLVALAGPFDGIFGAAQPGAPTATSSRSSDGFSRMPSAAESAATPPAASAELGSYPNPEESALLRRLTFDTTSCVRADADEIPRVPEYYFDGFRPMAVSASLRCPGRGGTEPDETLYFAPDLRPGVDPDALPGGLAEVDAAFLSIAGRQVLIPGECGGDAGQGYDYWSLGQQEGKLLCYVSTRGEAKLVWTVESDSGPVLAQAVALDEDLGRLYVWWRETGRLSLSQ